MVAVKAMERAADDLISWALLFVLLVAISSRVAHLNTCLNQRLAGNKTCSCQNATGNNYNEFGNATAHKSYAELIPLPLVLLCRSR